MRRALILVYSSLGAVTGPYVRTLHGKQGNNSIWRIGCMRLLGHRRHCISKALLLEEMRTEVCYRDKTLTNFHRCLDIRSMPVMGSMKTSFATRVSGTQIAHRRCTHSPVVVCLNAPPSLGHNMHAYSEDLRKTEMDEGMAEAYYWVLW